MVERTRSSRRAGSAAPVATAAVVPRVCPTRSPSGRRAPPRRAVCPALAPGPTDMRLRDQLLVAHLLLQAVARLVERLRYRGADLLLQRLQVDCPDAVAPCMAERTGPRW